MHYAHLDKLTPFLERLFGDESLLLLTFGDSNTCNTNFTAGAKQWPELLHSGLKDMAGTQKLLLLNAGVSGDMILDGLARFEVDVARFRPDLTVVCFGTNDANRISDSTFRDGLDRCLDRLDELGSLILLRTPTPIMEHLPPPGHIWQEDAALRAKVGIIREIAHQRHLPFVDTYQIWKDAESVGELDIVPLMADEVHTNAAGHQRVVADLFEAVAQVDSF